MNILVCFPSSLQLGGIERSFIGLLDALGEQSTIDTDVFIYGHHGELFPYVSKKVNLLPEVKELSYLQDSLMAKIQHGCIYAAWQRALCQIQKQDYFELADRVRRKKASALKKEYDIAISYFLPFDFILENVKAKKKIGWIHTDYSKAKCNIVALKKQYDMVDYIAGVSNDVCKSFCDIFPEYSNKVFTFENIIPEALVRSQADEIVDDFPDDGSIRLLSIGRFCEAKNFENIPEICSIIKKSGLNVKWYIIGFGAYESKIRAKIEEFGMGDNVIILGKKANPYPYIKQCDFYIQPSRYEGKAVTVLEAQMLCKPVIITDYPTANSQLKDGYDGVIVPLDNKKCAEGIVKVLRDECLQKKLSANCAVNDYSNKNEAKLIIKLVEESSRANVVQTFV